MSDKPAIQLKNVSFAYQNTPVFRDVTMSLAQRDFACVIGPNGGGKTTLLKLALGLVRPTRGEVRVLGQPPEIARQRIGYMPQHVALDPEFPVSVLDVVLMGRLSRRRWFGRYTAHDRAVARRVLGEVALEALERRPFATLSGGQRQRVLIARALACEPDMLLLDEPTANLDPTVQDDIYALLRDLNERMTVVIVSHDVGFVSVYFETAICVARGDAHTHTISDLMQHGVTNVYGRQVRVVHPEEHAHAKESAP